MRLVKLHIFLLLLLGWIFQSGSRAVCVCRDSVAVLLRPSATINKESRKVGPTATEGGGVGGLLYSKRWVSGAWVRKYDLENNRGDVTTQTDASGAVTWQAAYEAFGMRTAEAGTNADPQRGNTKDEDPTGLSNQHYRYLELETGVWLSRDPAGFVDGPNVYCYVRQNPWSSFDPEGLAGDEEHPWRDNYERMTSDEIAAMSKTDRQLMPVVGQTIVGFVPVVAQIIDLIDTVEAVAEVSSGKKGGMANLAFAMAAWIPGGDSVKGAHKLANAAQEAGKVAEVAHDAEKVAEVVHDAEKVADAAHDAQKATDAAHDASKVDAPAQASKSSGEASDAAKTPLARLQGSFDDLADQHLLPQFRALDPNLKAGYTGSFRTGTVGNPNKATFGQPIDLNKFDVDYWIESDILFKQFGPNLKANPAFRKVLSETPGFEGLKANKDGFSIKFKPSGG